MRWMGFSAVAECWRRKERCTWGSRGLYTFLELHFVISLSRIEPFSDVFCESRLFPRLIYTRAKIADVFFNESKRSEPGKHLSPSPHPSAVLQGTLLRIRIQSLRWASFMTEKRSRESISQVPFPFLAKKSKALVPLQARLEIV